MGLDDQIGRLQQAGTVADCASGEARYWFFWEMYPDPAVHIKQLVLKPGDAVSATVTATGGGRYTLTVRDLSSGEHFTTTQNDGGRALRAQLIVEAPAPYVLAPFGAVTFSEIGLTSTAGHTGDLLDPAWQAFRASMVLAGAPLATTSELSTGASFVVRSAI